MPYIIGTAGHIDHGKTSLIKALTGTDTDRLKEEKERGISIDLGFAHLDLPDGTSAGIVDVPGHERFIKNMLAGAHGIDLVLFTVAADDGVMPQTEEHLDIVHLLGIKLALFVITKADLVSPARIADIEEDIDILTLGTTLENSPKIAVSSVTRQGIPELKERIAVRGLKVNMAALRTANEATLEDQIKNMREQIDHAVFVGAEFGLTFGVDKAEHFENYYKLMQDAAPYAQEKGLKVVLKPHGGASGAAEEIVRCVKKVNHANFKVWFDAGNIIFYTGKDPVEQLKPIVQHVTGFCAKDCDKQKGSVQLEFGTGKVDFHAVFSEMKKAGFDGPVMVECCAPSATPEEATVNARKNREYLEKVFKAL